ncbi:MAG TPA: CapA family protein [Gemmatimonadales bacterium]|nr:CapA family protein [Gemmatimonadales bacterium]
MSERITLALAGDVMTGRGIDQILPHACPPHLYEPAASSALDYVALAEAAHGPIPRRVEPGYVWGAAAAALARVRPAAFVVNLETSLTTSEDALPKGINYRMHPANVGVLGAVGIGCCVLANNHVLDWGEVGLLETLATLARAGIPAAGAGRTLADAERPAVLAPAGTAAEAATRVLVLACGTGDSGIPPAWAAGPARPGVHRLPDLTPATVVHLGRLVAAAKRPGDVVVASVHWGGNWGWTVPRAQVAFAHALIDEAGVDVVHGHSSHHPKAIEVHHEHPILYGCGDFLDDYEGIEGAEAYRCDLALLYFVTLAVPGGRLLELTMTPLRLRRFRLEPAPAADRAWLARTLRRECGRFGRSVLERDDGDFALSARPPAGAR